MEENNQLVITPELYQRLKREYVKAQAEGLEVFEFEGQTLVVNYAKYMLEFLSSKMEK